jgi:hypothetical protein
MLGTHGRSCPIHHQELRNVSMQFALILSCIIIALPPYVHVTSTAVSSAIAIGAHVCRLSVEAILPVPPFLLSSIEFCSKGGKRVQEEAAFSQKRSSEPIEELVGGQGSLAFLVLLKKKARDFNGVKCFVRMESEPFGPSAAIHLIERCLAYHNAHQVTKGHALGYIPDRHRRPQGRGRPYRCEVSNQSLIQKDRLLAGKPLSDDRRCCP